MQITRKKILPIHFKTSFHERKTIYAISPMFEESVYKARREDLSKLIFVIPFGIFIFLVKVRLSYHLTPNTHHLYYVYETYKSCVR